MKEIDVSKLYNGNAKLSELENYIAKAISLAGEGQDVVLTGQGPIWLYLKIAHALHGKARKLIYRSPVSGDVVIFDHSPD
ncbi:MAG TPA: CRISPR-associated protein Csx3 [Syntrophorhabdaceae bacterium]|nr:CRISPR-associated protein Csx3 [Syntrophorhabdaceae bacterium]HOL04849.1 CRISPR-associated protein Csx3 [Syntrophorhabdaceae bacterium]HQG79222.1 CRISPR-associated protein Csx3 [bacterium]